MEKFVAYFRRITLVNFAGIVMLFLLPFVTVSCGGMSAGELSGKDLTFGTRIEHVQPMTQRKQTTMVKKEPSAVVALAAAVAGIVVSLLFKGVVHGRLVLLLSVLGTGAMLWLHQALNTQAINQGQGMILLDWRPAYWLTLGLFVSAGVMAMIWFKSSDQ